MTSNDNEDLGTNSRTYHKGKTRSCWGCKKQTPVPDDWTDGVVWCSYECYLRHG